MIVKPPEKSSLSLRSGRKLLRRDKKRKRPRQIESWDARRTALPRSLFTITLRYDFRRGNSSDGPLWKWLLDVSMPKLARWQIARRRLF
jgi:hypothetical protein